MSSLLLFLLLLLPQTKPVGDGAAVRVTTHPRRVIVERSAAGQLVNCDLAVENLTGETLTINEIEVSVFDARGALVLRKFVNDNGGRPSILTVPNREVESKKTILVFNPLYFFDHGVELSRLRFKVSLSTKDGKAKHEASADASPVAYETKTALALPVRGRVLVWDGHDFYSHHRRWDYLHPFLYSLGFRANAGRFGYDFVHVNERGEMRDGPEERNESWFAFGRPVFAAGAGRVADTHDRMADDRRFDEAEVLTRELAPAGNYVVIDHGNGEFSIFMHLKRASVRVKAGDRVERGQQIAEVGASGSSLFPHLHYELRDGAGYKTVEGLPSYFRGFRRHLGSKAVDVRRGQVDSGDIVESR
jgi:Peptidase family M23